MSGGRYGRTGDGSMSGGKYTLGEITGECISEDTYGYGNNDWKDQLTTFNGQSIVYDGMGNPTQYLGNALSWDNIRRLMSYVNDDYTISYTYNDEGIRTSKTVNGVKHEYVLEGSTILFEKYNDVVVIYFYDEAGAPIGMAYRKASEANLELDMEDQFEFYLFTKNLQGDILNIYSEDGTKVASYSYDAWGNHTVTNYTSDNIGNINTFRYRGYYFDSETNFYYLNSRYYDPQVKRFLNADIYVTTGQGLNSYNMYAYCNNNPVMYVDPTGEIAWWVVAIIVVAVVIAIDHAVSGVEYAIASSEVEDSYTIEQATEKIEEITGDDTVTFAEDNVQIKDSYNIHSRYDRIKISKIIKNTVDDEGNKLTNRTTYGLSAEWAGHNLLFNSYFERNTSTQHVNLDYDFKDNATKTKIGTIGLMIVGWL